MQKLTTFLMFVGRQCGKAEEAMRFYTALFPGSSIDSVERWQEGEPGGSPGLVKRARFTLAGHQYMASENTIEHGFTFTPSISIHVDCESTEEIDNLYGRLLEGGEVLMELDNYGFSKHFAWVADRYGVSWQLNQA